MTAKIIVEADVVTYGKYRAVARTNASAQIDEIIIERVGRDALGAERWEHQHKLKWADGNESPLAHTMFVLLSQVAKEKL